MTTYFSIHRRLKNNEMEAIQTQMKIMIFLLYLIGTLHAVTAAFDVPLLVNGPIGSNDIKSNVDFGPDLNDLDQSEPTPMIEKIDIKSNVTKRVETTVVKCYIKNPAIRKSQQIGITLELPQGKYQIKNLTLQALGDQNVYTAEKSNNDNIQEVYQNLSKRGQAGVMIREIVKSLPKSFNAATRLLSLNAHIPPGEKMLITLTYNGSLRNGENNTFRHVLHVNPHQPVQSFKLFINITDSLPIVDANAVEIRDTFPVFNSSTNEINRASNNTINVTFEPKVTKSKIKDPGYHMSGQFVTTYSVDKNALLDKVAEKITSLGEYNDEYQKMVGAIGVGVTFMITTLFMLPFIILTEIANGMVLIIDELMGIDSYDKPWLDETTRKPWYANVFEQEVEKLEKHWKPWDLVKVPNTDYVGPSHHTIEKIENMFEKFHGEEHPEKFANFDLDFGADKPLDRWDTSLEDWGHTMGNKWGPWLGEKIGNMVNRKHRIFSWTATGSFSFARSLGKSLLDFFR